MKTFYASLMGLGLLIVTGCNKSTSGGTPGEGTFKLNGPSNVTATEIKHSEQKTVAIDVSADKGFKEGIAFSAKVEPADKGVTAEISPKELKPGDYKKVELTVKASDKAAPGEYTVTVVGKPTKGNETSIGVKYKVPEKK